MQISGPAARVLCVCVPGWPIDRLLRRWRGSPDGLAGSSQGLAREPLLMLVRASGGRELVAHACPGCEGLGVRAGMALSDARALVPPHQVARLRLVRHHPGHDRAGLLKLARWALRWSPTVMPVTPDAQRGVLCAGLLMDVAGTQGLHPSEAHLVARVSGALARAGVRATLAVAGTPGAAWAAAWGLWGSCGRGAAGPMIIPQGATRAEVLDAVAGLPVQSLRLSPELLTKLRGVRIERVEHLVAIARAKLARTLGLEALTRLDQVTGLVDEPLEGVRPARVTRAERVLTGPTDRPEAVAKLACGLIGPVLAQLGPRGRGVRELVLVLRSAQPRHVPDVRVRVRLGRACASERHLRTLLLAALERTDVSGGVEVLRLTATRTGPLREVQRRMLDGGVVVGAGAGAGIDPQHTALGGLPTHVCELAEVLRTRLDPGRVLTACLHAAHVPEQAWGWKPWEVDDGGGASAGSFASGRADLVRGARPDRPTQLFERPEPAEVVFVHPGGPVAQVCWRGEVMGVVWCRGPEQIEDAWWQRGPDDRRAQRAYYVVHTQAGRTLWVCRWVRGAERGWAVQGQWG